MKPLKYVLLVPILYLVLSNIVYGVQIYSVSYNLKENIDDVTYKYKLNINVTDSMYNYYKNSDHKLTDFSKFITPNAVKPIASRLSQKYNITNDYVNGVLMIAHQITNNYSSQDPKFPIEYLVDKNGDCEVSYLVASLTIANGIKTVLFLWKDITIKGETADHVNVGVELEKAPVIRTAFDVFLFSKEYKGTTYYVAEGTGGVTLNREYAVGELSTDLRSYAPEVEVVEISSNDNTPYIMTADFDTSIKDSSISIDKFVPLISYFYLDGTIEPKLSNTTITIYVKLNNFFKAVGQTKTNDEGFFSYSYIPLAYNDIGYGSLAVYWEGNVDYKSAIAYPTLVLDTWIIAPSWLLLAIAVVVIVIIKY